MLDFLKQIGPLRAMQEQIKKEVVTLEQDGVKLTMRGDMQIQEIKIQPDLKTEQIEKTIISLHNRALAEIQSRLARSMSLQK